MATTGQKIKTVIFTLIGATPGILLALVLGPVYGVVMGCLGGFVGLALSLPGVSTKRVMLGTAGTIVAYNAPRRTQGEVFNAITGDNKLEVDQQTATHEELAQAERSAGRFNFPWSAFIIAFVGCIAFFGAYTMLDEIRYGNASADWPTASGQIKFATISTEKERGRKGRENTYYKANVEYSYEVDGQPHTGTRLKFSPVRSSEYNDLVPLVNQMSPGIEIEVHYNPKDPSMSVLIPGMESSRNLLFGVVMLIGLGAFVLSGINVLRFLRGH